MKSRIIFSLIFAFASFNLLAQPEISNLTFDGDEATLTRNN